MKCFLLALLCVPICAFAEGGLPAEPYIYVEGSSEIQRPPDMVTIRFKLGVRDRDQAVASKKIQEQAAAVFAMLDREKIAEKDVIAQNLTSTPEYDDDSTSPTEGGPGLTRESSGRKHGDIKQYALAREFSVIVRDVSLFPRVIDELLGLHVEEFTSIEAGLSSEEELTEQVAEKALANARQQAEKTLGIAHMRIDSVFAISTVPFEEIRGRMFMGRHAAVYPAFSQEPKVDPLQYRLAPVSISQTVNVLYLISPVK